MKDYIKYSAYILITYLLHILIFFIQKDLKSKFNKNKLK